MTHDNGIVEFVEEVAGIYFRSVLLPQAGTRIPQHVHDYAHASYIAQGGAILYVDGKDCGLYFGGQAVNIEAGKKHEFESIVPNTRITCLHIAEGAESMKRNHPWPG